MHTNACYSIVLIELRTIQKNSCCEIILFMTFLIFSCPLPLFLPAHKTNVLRHLLRYNLLCYFYKIIANTPVSFSCLFKCYQEMLLILCLCKYFCVNIFIPVKIAYAPNLNCCNSFVLSLS